MLEAKFACSNRLFRRLDPFQTVACHRLSRCQRTIRPARRVGPRGPSMIPRWFLFEITLHGPTFRAGRFLTSRLPIKTVAQRFQSEQSPGNQLREANNTRLSNPAPWIHSSRSRECCGRRIGKWLERFCSFLLWSTLILHPGCEGTRQSANGQDRHGVSDLAKDPTSGGHQPEAQAKENLARPSLALFGVALCMECGDVTPLLFLSFYGVR